MKKKSFTHLLLYFCLISLLFIFLACGDEGEIIQPPDSTQDGEDGLPPPEQPPPEEPLVSFAKDIKPIFDASCNFGGCHGANPPSGLSLTSYANFQKGGNGGPAFIPGDSDGSLIIKRISPPGGNMPIGGPPLEEVQIDIIKKWIDEGGEDN